MVQHRTQKSLLRLTTLAKFFKCKEAEFAKIKILENFELEVFVSSIWAGRE